MILRLPKKVHFLQFCADLSKESIKTIYLDVSERSYCALSGNGIIYHVLEILGFEVKNFC